jgi:hypothetical protein
MKIVPEQVAPSLICVNMRRRERRIIGFVWLPRGAWKRQPREERLHMAEKQVKRRRAPAAAKGAVEVSAGTLAAEQPSAALSAEERRRMIAEAAYFRAERRGFAVGGELDDWIQAEVEIDRLVGGGGSQSRHSLRHL